MLGTFQGPSHWGTEAGDSEEALDPQEASAAIQTGSVLTHQRPLTQPPRSPAWKSQDLRGKELQVLDLEKNLGTRSDEETDSSGLVI